MSRARRLALALPLLSVSLLGACASTASKEEAATEKAIEDAMAKELAPATPEEVAAAERADPLTRANFWAAEFRKDPTKLDVTIKYVTALRDIGSQQRAIDVIAKTLPTHPKSTELYIIMGRALMSDARPGEAADAYYRASVLEPQNATASAGLGLALDQLERHADAQKAYRAALEIDPNRVSTRTNYGLSLALSGNLTAAEAELREAASLPGADARVRQNLALILGLQGDFEEARKIDPHAPKRTVDSNLDALRSMLSPVRDYGSLRDETPASKPAKTPSQEEASTAPQLRGSLNP
ncbi:tetratricopeptide repeat protein [Henriciella aquimarina]|uniref:tetratricopeptide repeat protein n=1 Tax=Henriciella aquimarina TaxID=545261 RepID=UPI000A04A079|nr:tetratricopeptide repeat protein [Henriciella aquimarina]